MKWIYHIVFLFQRNTKDSEYQNQYHVYAESGNVYKEEEISFSSVVGVW